MTVQNPASHRNGAVERSALQILVCAAPITGHTLPLITVADALVRRGYPVSFLAGAQFKERIEQVGARFFSIPSFDLAAISQQNAQIELAEDRARFNLTKLCIEPMAERKDALYRALEDLKDRFPCDKVVILSEMFFVGDRPMYFGAPLPRGFVTRPRVVSIHAIPYVAHSRDTAPFGSAAIPEKDEKSRDTYMIQHHRMNVEYAQIISMQQKAMVELGGVDCEKTLPLDLLYLSADAILQMCSPSLEYERSDMSPKVRFAGALQARSLEQGFQFPTFWPQVTAGDRKVVVVTQGTVNMRYEQLVIPTLEALADRSDLLMVVILGQRGASLPSNVTIPSNARVIDYLSYDAVLPHASAFVMNAGYGGFIHGMLNGVPMVLAGGSEEKPEVAARGEYAGVAVNLRTGTPSVESIRQAVDLVLRESRFKKRVMEIRQENMDLKPLDTIESTILEMALLDTD